MRDEVSEYTDHERALFTQLRRECSPDAALEDRVVAALKAEGYFARPPRNRSWAMAIAAGLVLLVLGGAGGAVIGARVATRNSLETLIARKDLAVPERVLLLQRAGSAYVRAAHAYADATARADSTAVEVASQVLLGAARAVSRSRLDSRISAGLTTVLQRTSDSPTPKSTPSILWF